MSNFFSDLFGTTKKDTTYTGTKPVTSLSQVQGGPEYYKAILDRSNGIGTGYGADYTSNANPQIKQLHDAYTGYELPELQSELTATGRRAGSSGFQQVSRSMSDEADKENSIMAQLMQRNAEASHTDQTNAIGDVGNYAENEANLVGQRANFDYADNARQVAEAQKIQDNRSKENSAIGQAGVQLLFGQNASDPISSQTSSAPSTYYNGSGTSQPPIGQQDYYKQMLARNIASSAQQGRV